VLDPFGNRDVILSGKVAFPISESGEVWPGTICLINR
jgi:hypothetical protein